MYINTFKYKPEDVSCVLCTEYVKKLGCTALSCPCLAERMEAGTEGDLAEPQIIPDETFRLLINALLIARFGLDALKITARRGQREYTLRRLIRREARGNAPSAGLLFPSEGR